MSAGRTSMGIPAHARATASLLHDHGFARAFMEGMRNSPKRVPCKYFYDAVGSVLFDEICELPEYYQTRTERSLLFDHAHEIASVVGTRVCAILGNDYPALQLEPVIADFTRPFALPMPKHGEARRVGFFPGSTIGNFSPDEAIAFLKTVSGIVRGGGILIGVDLIKDPGVLHAAYNDARGVTAAFNKNLVARANRELDANFDLDAFAHRAFFNRSASRIEMHLVSLADQEVQVGDDVIEFARQESVHTEDSYKYSIESFQALAWKAGLVPRRVWSDRDRFFSVHWLEAD